MDKTELQRITDNLIAEFTKIQDDYRTSKYKLECSDDEYKDSENNIFDDSRRWKLDQFIAAEAQLYRQVSFSFDDLTKRLNRLSNNVSDWLKSMRGRGIQGISQAKKIYDSEKYYLRDMKLRVTYFSKLTGCLSSLQKQEDELFSKGIEISVDSGYEAYQLNKCIIMGLVPYCKSECTKLVKELNDRVSNSPLFSGEFYYKLAELNFTLQRYKDADLLIDRAILSLKRELQFEHDEQQILQKNDMLFSAYQLKALGLEFCGDYSKSIQFLTGSSPEELVDIFKEHLPNHNYSDLVFSIDTYSTFGEKAEENRKNIVQLLGTILHNNIFSGEVADYVYDEKNQDCFLRIVDQENSKIEKVIYSCCPETYSKKVFDANRIEENDVDLLNEFVHILAHCINEQGVTLLKEADTSIAPDFAESLVWLGRALMLYVSEKREIYKSCFATTYAEAGDTWIAHEELKRIIEHPDYSRYDVTTKAEIAFFYHIINSAMLLENGLYDSETETESGIYNRYLNYCYRSFDYDAIAHMRVYSFRNKIAEIMQTGDLPNMAETFLSFASQTINGKTPFQDFMENVYFQNTNERLRCEYEKVKYMYSFLLAFFKQCISKDSTPVVRDNHIIDVALKYLHYYNASVDNLESKVISYIDFSNSENNASQILNVIHGSVSLNGVTKSNHCRLATITTEEEAERFVKRIHEYYDDAQNHMFFVACNSEGLMDNLKKELREFFQIYPKFRFFPTIEQGIKEFVIFTTFFMIQDDFTDPNNIFVMTPIGTAKSCRYRVSGTVELICKCFANEEQSTVGTQKEINAQFRAVSECLTKELPWEDRLNTERYDKYISLLVSVIYDTNANTNTIKYKYKYRVSDDWTEAILFGASKWKRNIDNLYSSLKYESPKVALHRSECSNGVANCSVILLDDVINSSKDVRIDDNKFTEIMSSLSNILLADYRKALIWKGSNNSFVSWRIAIIKETSSETIVNEIRQSLCCKGKELMFSPPSSIRKMKKYSWPPVHDYDEKDEPFLFISHLGADDDLVKRELNEFFVRYGIPIWYDKDKLIRDETWKERITRVIGDRNCVGIVILITSERFFSSKPIQFEIETASEVKKESKKRKDFSIIPIVYGLVTNHGELRNLIIHSITDDDVYLRVKKAIIPSDDKVITYLMPNQSLLDYTIGEQNEGRDGSVLKAISELKIIIKENKK